MSQMFKRGKKVKLLIVVAIDTLKAERGGDLIEIIERLNKMFKEDFLLLRDATALVVTKVPMK